MSRVPSSPHRLQPKTSRRLLQGVLYQPYIHHLLGYVIAVQAVLLSSQLAARNGMQETQLAQMLAADPTSQLALQMLAGGGKANNFNQYTTPRSSLDMSGLQGAAPSDFTTSCRSSFETPQVPPPLPAPPPAPPCLAPPPRVLCAPLRIPGSHTLPTSAAHLDKEHAQSLNT